MATTTDHFKALALYPGGQEGGGIRFTDPYPVGGDAMPNGMFRITCPASKIIPLLYNRKEWNVSMSAAFNLDDTFSPDIYKTIHNYVPLTLTASGKFDSLEASFDDSLSDVAGGLADMNLYARVAEPKAKICGAGKFTDITDTVTDMRCWDSWYGDYSPRPSPLLPSLNVRYNNSSYYSSNHFPPAPARTGTVTRGVTATGTGKVEVDVGSLAFDIQPANLPGGGAGGLFYNTEIVFNKIWIRPDGYIDVFITPRIFRTINAFFSDSATGVGGSLDCGVFLPVGASAPSANTLYLDGDWWHGFIGIGLDLGVDFSMESHIYTLGDDAPAFGWRDDDISISVLDKRVNGIWRSFNAGNLTTRGGVARVPVTSTLEFTYDVTVSEAWEY